MLMNTRTEFAKQLDEPSLILNTIILLLIKENYGDIVLYIFFIHQFKMFFCFVLMRIKP